MLRITEPTPGPDDSDPPDETLSIPDVEPGPNDSDPPQGSRATSGANPNWYPGPYDDDPPPPPTPPPTQ
jgi:hypothetical protein